MILGYSTPPHDSFGQPPVGLPVMWGLAARAQSQSTPGASALVAPHQPSFACTRRTCLLTKLPDVLEAAVVVAGCGGFVTGMYLLATSPLRGVVVVFASMALLLGSVAKLSKAREVRQESDSGASVSLAAAPKVPAGSTRAKMHGTMVEDDKLQENTNG